MKKILQIFSMIILLFVFEACEDLKQFGQNPSPTPSQLSTEVKREEDKSVGSKYKFPENIRVMGNGKIIINTPMETSEQGTAPALVLDKSATKGEIGIELLNYRSDKKVFIFVNKIFLYEMKGGYKEVQMLDLRDQNIIPGEFIISAIQFENDNPNGKVIEYNDVKYRVQLKDK